MKQVVYALVMVVVSVHRLSLIHISIDVVGDKLTVYFSGIHTDLRRQTREGMSRVIMERMLFGENFREIVRNALVSNMPNWTAYGFVSYLVDGWDAKENSDWKNILEAHPKSSFYQLAEKYPDQAGKAFWKYIADKNGDNGAKNLLYTIPVSYTHLDVYKRQW